MFHCIDYYVPYLIAFAIQQSGSLEFTRECWILSRQSILHCASRKGIFSTCHSSIRLLKITQITALTNAKDSERLQLLKEVAGTRVYEQRRIESLKIMQETGKILF